MNYVTALRAYTAKRIEEIDRADILKVWESKSSPKADA